MPIPVTIPRLGWNMEEGVFVEWLKADGDPVKPGDAVFRLEGEKATEDIESLDAGTLHVPANGPKTGDRLAVGATIGYLLHAGEGRPTPPAPRPTGRGEEDTGASESAPARGGSVSPLPSGRGAGGVGSSSDTAVTPRARRAAARLGVDPSALIGTGRNGRVRACDVTSSKTSAKPHAARAVIAARMMESRATTAPVTLTSLVDATNLVNLRAQFKAAGGDVPSYTDILFKLVAVALQKHPALAARWTDAGIVPAASIDIGFAVDTDAGLLVPVVRDVPALGLRAVAARTKELIDRARGGTLSARDMGGCFTITNLGAFGIDAFTPIINPPECAILGIGRIERRPVMDGDRVVGRDQLTLSLTFDHRIVDGAPAARFLQALAACVANPAAWVSS
ncbi:MAG: 2-oxo acid dehydrogenase subunit E2 [Planctomycetes bacterium]|nr:2-oxo acid dehydrogenase subunit E2 [Planctomycetota bacterium]